MTSPARQHWQHKTAATAGENPAAAQRASDQHELMAAALWEARQTLKGIQSIERKIEYKREALPQFDAYIDGVLESGTGEQDDVLMTLMLWRLDTGDITGGMEIAQYALQHELQAPDRFQRSLPALIVEQTAEEALGRLEGDDAEEGNELLIAQLETVDNLTQDADMHDQVRAKLYKALGYACRLDGNPQEALEYLNRARDLNAKAGVVKDIEKLEREIKKQNAGGQPS